MSPQLGNKKKEKNPFTPLTHSVYSEFPRGAPGVEIPGPHGRQRPNRDFVSEGSPGISLRKVLQGPVWHIKRSQGPSLWKTGPLLKRTPRAHVPPFSPTGSPVQIPPGAFVGNVFSPNSARTGFPQRAQETKWRPVPLNLKGKGPQEGPGQIQPNWPRNFLVPGFPPCGPCRAGNQEAFSGLANPRSWVCFFSKKEGIEENFGSMLPTRFPPIVQPVPPRGKPGSPFNPSTPRGPCSLLAPPVGPVPGRAPKPPDQSGPKLSQAPGWPPREPTGGRNQSQINQAGLTPKNPRMVIQPIPKGPLTGKSRFNL